LKPTKLLDKNEHQDDAEPDLLESDSDEESQTFSCTLRQ